MKQIYLFLTLLVALTGFGQGTPIITMIADGDESGGTPKVLEIYANGTVDFTQYTLQNQTNGNSGAGSWGRDFDLSPLGTVTDEFVYVYKDGDLSGQSAFEVNFPSVDASHRLDTGNASVLNINGDDRVRIIETSSTNVIDIYGQDGVDGTGTVWEYKDGYAKRLNGTGPDPVFVEANWEFHKGELNGHGAVQDNTTYESIISIGAYTPPTSVSPILAITAPTAGQVFSPVTTSVDVTFTVQNFTVGTDGNISWRLDGGSWSTQSTTNPITLSGLTSGNHTIDLKLVDNSNADLTPAVEASVTFEIATYTVVHTIAALRAGTVGDYYHFDGEAFIIGGQVYPSGAAKGYAQDATGGILAFVPPGTSTNVPNLYDGIRNLKGKLKDYHGVLEIELTEDFTMTGNNEVQTPQVVTLSNYIANHDDYESELIQFNNVTIDPGSDTAFQSSTNYDVTDGTDTVVLRTAFNDLVGETIPTGAVDITGIGAQYNSTLQIFPRDINDIVDANAIAENNIDGLEVYPNPVINKQIFVTSASADVKQIIIYNVLGKAVYKTKINNGQAINVGELKAGIYMMKIIENGQVGLQKLIIK